MMCQGKSGVKKISEALNHFPSPVFVIQEFMKPRTFMHPVFSEGNEVSNESGRVRLSPYFSPLIKKQNGQVRWLLFALPIKNYSWNEGR